MSFRQIMLVFQREYMTKIRSKAFIIATLLIPIGLIAFIGVIAAISLWDSAPELKIGIADQTELLYPRLQQLDEERYVNLADLSEDSLRSMVINEKINGYIFLRDAQISSDQNRS